MLCTDNEESWTPEALERLAENYVQITRMTLGPLLLAPAGCALTPTGTAAWWFFPLRWQGASSVHPPCMTQHT